MAMEINIMDKNNPVKITELFDLLRNIKKDTSDPSLFMSLREDGSGVVESAATKEIFAVWMNPEELVAIIEEKKNG